MLSDERTKAEVIFVSDRKVRVIDDNGFEYLLPKSKIVLIDKENDKSHAYGNSFYIKEDDIKGDMSQSKLFTKDKSKKGCQKIDLHIEEIYDNYHKIENFEIVQIQLAHCKKQIEIAIKKHLSKLIIVHGIGEGVLKKEVHDLLRIYNLKFFESGNGGSTEVFL